MGYVLYVFINVSLVFICDLVTVSHLRLHCHSLSKKGEK